MTTKVRVTQHEKILNFLGTGKTLWQKRAKKVLGVKRLSARIGELRQAGYPIYRNGETYRLGTPSRKMVALAYKRAGAAAFE
jgi:hypothetical protein